MEELNIGERVVFNIAVRNSQVAKNMDRTWCPPLDTHESQVTAFENDSGSTCRRNCKLLTQLVQFVHEEMRQVPIRAYTLRFDGLGSRPSPFTNLKVQVVRTWSEAKASTH